MGKHIQGDDMRRACAEIVKELGAGDPQGAVPFLKNAVERAGYPYKTVANWIYDGERSPDDHPIQAEFARMVRMIQGVWKSNVERLIASTDKDTAERARRLSWFLERLDRETYDISRDDKARKHAARGGSDKPAHKRSAEELEAGLDGTVEPTANPEKTLQ